MKISLQCAVFEPQSAAQIEKEFIGYLSYIHATKGADYVESRLDVFGLNYAASKGLEYRRNGDCITIAPASYIDQLLTQAA